MAKQPKMSPIGLDYPPEPELTYMTPEQMEAFEKAQQQAEPGE